MSIFIRTVPNVMRHYGCTAEVAQRYIDLRDEGHGTEQAALMAGLADPPEPDRAPVDTLKVSRKAVIKKCVSGRMEHLMAPEWEGRSYAFMKCRWCGKREAV